MTTTVGRLFWVEGRQNPSPWVSFPNVTAYRRWARDIRKALPGTKTEFHYVDAIHSAESLLRIAQTKGRG